MMTRYLGIDPGFDRCGFGIVDDAPAYIASGVIQTKSEWTYWQRLETIYAAIGDLLARYQVQAAGVEKPFIGGNLRYGIEVAGVWGVVGLSIRQAGVEYLELTTTQVKAAVANGRASKAEVLAGVMMILSLQVRPAHDDESDALAAAVCCRDRWIQAQMIREALL